MCKVKWSDDEIQLYKLIINPDDRHPDEIGRAHV